VVIFSEIIEKECAKDRYAPVEIERLVLHCMPISAIAYLLFPDCQYTP